MTGTHWLALAGCLVSISAMGSAMHDWAELARPAFLFGVLGVVGSNIASALTKPKDRP